MSFYLIGIITLVTCVIIFIFSFVSIKIIPPLSEDEEEEYQKKNKAYKERKLKKLLKLQNLTLNQEEANQLPIEDYRIVGLRKPSGKWTKMIMLEDIAERLAFLQFCRKRNKSPGFWQIKIEFGKSRFTGKNRGRSR